MSVVLRAAWSVEKIAWHCTLSCGHSKEIYQSPNQTPTRDEVICHECLDKEMREAGIKA